MMNGELKWWIKKKLNTIHMMNQIENKTCDKLIANV